MASEWYNKATTVGKVHEMTENTLRFTANVGSSTSSIKLTTNSGSVPAVYYRINGEGPYAQLASNTTITIDAGDYMDVYGINPSGFSTGSTAYSTFTVSGNMSVSGNIMALISKDCPNTIPCSYCFRSLFYCATGLTDASQLKLPARTLTTYCYYHMFQNCTSLVNSPELPAMSLADYCYEQMFQGCTHLISAPELPALSLSGASYCYEGMFSSCTNLSKAPELPATVLTGYCYYQMFASCTSLSKAPVLPAETLNYSSYAYMFQDCTSLTYVKALFTTTPGSSYTNYWLDGVYYAGTFVKSPNATWSVSGVHGIPTDWTTKTAGY